MNKRSNLLVTASVVISLALMLVATIALGIGDAVFATFCVACACYSLAWAVFVCVYVGTRL